MRPSFVVSLAAALALLTAIALPVAARLGAAAASVRWASARGCRASSASART